MGVLNPEGSSDGPVPKYFFKEKDDLPEKMLKWGKDLSDRLEVAKTLITDGYIVMPIKIITEVQEICTPNNN